jgi:hypothetical protein
MITKTAKWVEGTAPTLRQAKRIVEEEYKRLNPENPKETVP